MILEGIVTTIGSEGEVNVAPMGPRVEPDLHRFILRPFRTARTYANLKLNGQGVFHVTDDVLLLARAAVGELEPPPPLVPATVVRGYILRDACRFYEFRVKNCDDRGDRAAFDAEVVHAGRFRDFFGFNRAKHAVVEAAILATRIGLPGVPDILAEFARLAPLIEKTGGEQERRAFAFLGSYVRRLLSQLQSNPSEFSSDA
jgi:hypothetical protein